MINGVIKEIERRLPKLAASRSANFMDDQQETQMFRAMGWFISLLAVLGGGLGMMNTMLMSVFERTREIGVLRALGWRRGRILRMILGEALLLCVVGGALGIGLGAWMAYALNQVPALAGMLDNALTPGDHRCKRLSSRCFWARQAACIPRGVRRSCSQSKRCGTRAQAGNSKVKIQNSKFNLQSLFSNL